MSPCSHPVTTRGSCSGGQLCCPRQQDKPTGQFDGKHRVSLVQCISIEITLCERCAGLDIFNVLCTGVVWSHFISIYVLFFVFLLLLFYRVYDSIMLKRPLLAKHKFEQGGDYFSAYSKWMYHNWMFRWMPYKHLTLYKIDNCMTPWSSVLVKLVIHWNRIASLEILYTWIFNKKTNSWF